MFLFWRHSDEIGINDIMQDILSEKNDCSVFPIKSSSVVYGGSIEVVFS